MRSAGGNCGIVEFGSLDAGVRVPLGAASHSPGRREPEAVTEANVLTDRAVERLIVEADGTVVGVVAHRYAEQLSIRTRRGVVLTAVGFVFNEAMPEQLAPTLPGHARVGGDHDDGTAIKIAQAIGLRYGDTCSDRRVDTWSRYEGVSVEVADLLELEAGVTSSSTYCATR